MLRNLRDILDTTWRKTRARVIKDSGKIYDLKMTISEIAHYVSGKYSLLCGK